MSHYIHYLRVAALWAVFIGAAGCSTARMDKQQAAEWYGRYQPMVRWVGYQGSDSQYHYYVARVMDDWAFIRMKRDEVTVQDERPYSGRSDAPLYYYPVDPARNYVKIEN